MSVKGATTEYHKLGSEKAKKQDKEKQRKEPGSPRSKRNIKTYTATSSPTEDSQTSCSSFLKMTIIMNNYLQEGVIGNYKYAKCLE